MTRAFVRNTLTSVVTTALDFATLLGLVELAHVNYVLATFFGTVVGASSNFLINRHWSFEASGSRAHWQILRFVPVQAGSSGLQTLGVWFLTAIGQLPYLGSKLVIAVVVYLIWNYPMNRYFVFRKVRSSTPAGTSRLSA